MGEGGRSSEPSGSKNTSRRLSLKSIEGLSRRGVCTGRDEAKEDKRRELLREGGQAVGGRRGKPKEEGWSGKTHTQPLGGGEAKKKGCGEETLTKAV